MYFYCFLVINPTALREGEYFIVGRAMAVSLVHGGPAPTFLSPVMYSYLTESRFKYSPTLADITDPELREEVEEVMFMYHVILLCLLEAVMQC